MNAAWNSNFILISNNASNQTFASIHAFLRAFGSSQVIEMLNISLFLLTSCLGIITNSISLVIFFKKEFVIPLYDYLRVYVMTGFGMSIMQVTYPFFNCKTLFFETSNSNWGVYYVTFVYGVVQTILLCFIFMIDLVIVVDRIATFNLRFKSLYNRMHPNHIICILLVFSAIIMLPHRFSTDIIEHKLYETRTRKIVKLYFITVNTSFTNRFAGKLILNSIYVFRNGVTLILDITLNLISVYYFRKFASKRKRLVNMLSMSLDTASGSGGSLGKPSTLETRISKARTFKSERKAIFMVITLSVISVVYKTQMNVTFLYHFFGKSKLTLTGLYFMTNWFSSLRNVTSFFIFYVFDRNFKKALDKHLINLKQEAAKLCR
jgi:hypothetical protein